jgi:AcrR family transcriptional regulator
MSTAPRRGAPAPGSGRSRLSGERRRESILTVALHAFAARGYDGVRTQELAQAAAVSEALLYQHFGSKRELYEAVVLRSSEAMQTRVEETAAGAPVAERLEREVRALVEFVADRSSGWSLLTSSVSDPALAKFQADARRACISRLAALFLEQAGGSRSAAVKRRVEQLTEALAGGAEALANWWNENPKAARGEGTSMLLDFARRELESILEPAALRRAKDSRRSPRQAAK